MKNKFKFILSIFTVFSIFVSIFSMCVSAAETYTTISVDFSMDSQYISVDNSDAKEAFERLIVRYLTLSSGNLSYVSDEPMGRAYTADVVYDSSGDFPIKFVNASYWIFSFELLVDNSISLGRFDIPAYSDGANGVYSLDLSDIFTRYPNATSLKFSFTSAYQPVYGGPVLNNSYSKISYRTPDGTFRVDTVVAPTGHYGSYSVLFQELVNDNIIERVPEYHDGFKIDFSTVPTTIIVDPNRVNVYYIDYTGVGKIVNVNYYDPYGVFIRNVQYSVDINATSFTIPTNQDYLYAPLKLDLSMGIPEQAFNVYQIDFQGQRDEAYQSGFKDGSDFGLRDLEAQLKESYDNGYNKGFEDGFDDGSVITGAERNEIAKDYNAITGFFDGIYNTLFGSIDYIFDGIGLGGVTLGEVVWTLVIVFVVVLIVRKMF